MNSTLLNSLLVLGYALAVVGVGHYATEVYQPRRLDGIEDQIKYAKLQQVEVDQLLIELAASSELADDVLRKWKTRYKYMPETLNTAEMVLYLEGLTSYGFEQFDVSLQGITKAGSHSYYTYKVKATAFFDSFYKFIWHIENNREFYRIEDLSISHTAVYKENRSTERLRRMDMVSASFTLRAYFADENGISASSEDLMPVPDELLPRKSAAHNSFFPIVRTDLPPNDENLPDLEKAELVSIIGDRAVFDWEDRQYILAKGDRVYLGQIVKVDPKMALVRARLNKGGKVEVLDIRFDVGDRYRQAGVDGVQVKPIDEF